MKDINLNKSVVIEIDTTSIDFSATVNQAQIMSSLDDYTGNRVAKDISGINTIDSSSLNPTAEIKHEDNETVSVRIEFNKKMNYSDVESKLSIIDNSSSSVIGFMPVWNNKTLHLVVDTDNGTSSTVESNPLTSGRTYKVNPLVSIPELWKNKIKTIDCGGYSITCGIHFTIVNGIVFYNNYVVNSNIESYELKATRISDNTTVTLLSPNSTCTENCYKFNNLYEQHQTYY